MRKFSKINLMDNKTLLYYSKNYVNIAEKYNTCISGVSDYFPSFTAHLNNTQLFNLKFKILDIGCGSGRDLYILQKMGFQVVGIDPCKEFINSIKTQALEKSINLFVDSLPNLANIADDEYDGVLCSAVFMHIPEPELYDSAVTIRRILKKNGRLLLSIPHKDKTIDKETQRDSNGRLFNCVFSKDIKLLFEQIGFKLLSNWQSDDSLSREYRKWSTMLFELEDTK